MKLTVFANTYIKQSKNRLFMPYIGTNMSFKDKTSINIIKRR